MQNGLADRHPLSRVEYDHLVAQGKLDDRRVELLRGEIVPVSPQGPLHSTVVRRLLGLIARSLGGSTYDSVELQVQAPLAVSDDSEPEPDLAVIEVGDYTHEHPTTALLVIEVADSSLTFDRRVKASVYAECGIPEYWLVNLVEQVVEVYSRPEAGVYRVADTRGPGDVLASAGLPTLRIAVDDVL